MTRVNPGSSPGMRRTIIAAQNSLRRSQERREFISTSKDLYSFSKERSEVR
ncbi:hypothetical protein [Streptomyces sp. NPDC058812]|uniref:hypothetical protein n=1 Tax=unclassified Streptomyces TaxID=2593676 RepID=UPI003692E016